MKAWNMMMGAAVIGMFFAGCATNKEVEDQYKTFKENRPTAGYVKTGDANVDQLGKTVAGVYKETTKYLDEYYSATEGHRDYVMFENRVEGLKKEGKTYKEAGLIAKNEAIAAEKKEGGPKKGEPDVWTKIVKAQKAQEQLNPSKKLKTLLPLSIEIAKLIPQAAGLANSFSGFDMNTFKKLNATKKILEQANYTNDALSFIIRKYQAVEAFKNNNVFEGR